MFITIIIFCTCLPRSSTSINSLHCHVKTLTANSTSISWQLYLVDGGGAVYACHRATQPYASRAPGKGPINHSTTQHFTCSGGPKSPRKHAPPITLFNNANAQEGRCHPKPQMTTFNRMGANDPFYRHVGYDNPCHTTREPQPPIHTCRQLGRHLLGTTHPIEGALPPLAIHTTM